MDETEQQALPPSKQEIAIYQESLKSLSNALEVVGLLAEKKVQVVGYKDDEKRKKEIANFLIQDRDETNAKAKEPYLLYTDHEIDRGIDLYREWSALVDMHPFRSEGDKLSFNPKETGLLPAIEAVLNLAHIRTQVVSELIRTSKANSLQEIAEVLNKYSKSISSDESVQEIPISPQPQDDLLINKKDSSIHTPGNSDIAIEESVQEVPNTEAKQYYAKLGFQFVEKYFNKIVADQPNLN